MKKRNKLPAFTSPKLSVLISGSHTKQKIKSWYFALVLGFYSVSNAKGHGSKPKLKNKHPQCAKQIQGIAIT